MCTCVLYKTVPLFSTRTTSFAALCSFVMPTDAKKRPCPFYKPAVAQFLRLQRPINPFSFFFYKRLIRPYPPFQRSRDCHHRKPVFLPLPFSRCTLHDWFSAVLKIRVICTFNISAVRLCDVLPYTVLVVMMA